MERVHAGCCQPPRLAWQRLNSAFWLWFTLPVNPLRHCSSASIASHESCGQSTVMRCKVKSFAVQSVSLNERRDYERGSCVYRWRPPRSQLLIIKAFRRRYLLLNSSWQPGCSERKKQQGNNPLWIHWDSYLIAGWIDAPTCGQSADSSLVIDSAAVCWCWYNTNPLGFTRTETTF